MRVLIGVLTCHKLDYYVNELTQDYLSIRGWRSTDQQKRVNTMRETWLKDLPVDYKFFYGNKLRPPETRKGQTPITLREPLADEVYLNCGDNYTSNPAKMKEMCKYAGNEGYDYLIRVDDDTFVYPNHLLLENWLGHDYSGSGRENFHPGGCMVLSRRAMGFIIDAPITNWADDVWIGSVMQKHRVPMNFLPSIHNEFGEGYRVNPDTVKPGRSALHSCTPEVMRVLYERNEHNSVS
jgi:hypothetical protein